MIDLCAGAAITSFINDDQAFKASIEDRFTALDVNGDGLISFVEMASELLSLRMLNACFGLDGVRLSHPELVELHRDIFSCFDRDGNRTVGLLEFGEEMKEMLAAVADRIGMPKDKSFLHSKL